MKTCTKCGETKPCTSFGKKSKARGGGFESRCKDCIKAATAAWKAANPERAKASLSAWRTSNPGAASAWKKANPEKARAHSQAWKKANPEKIRAGSAAYYKANSEQVKARAEAWSKANPERSREADAAWYKANRERAREANAKWRAANPEAIRIRNQNRRALKSKAGGSLSRGLADHLFKLQRGKCACGCNQPLGDDYHMDHIMPLILGGTNTDNNIQLLRAICNLQKSAKHPTEFMQSRGFLL